MNDFQFYIPLQKGQGTEEMLEGVASTLAIDRDEERMSENAIEDMRRNILTQGVNLFGNHQHDWENTLGVIKNAERTPDHQLRVKIQLDDPTTNPKIPMLLNKISRGIKMGLSVGGKVTKEKWEYDKEMGKKIKIIDGVKLFEVSVVGIPANSESMMSIPLAMSKSFKHQCGLCFTKSMGKRDCPTCLAQLR